MYLQQLQTHGQQESKGEVFLLVAHPIDPLLFLSFLGLGGTRTPYYTASIYS